MNSKPEKDIRVAATSKIWAFATGMLAICIPLAGVTRSGPILPLAAIAGAATGTYFVWRDDSKQKSLANSDSKQLEQRVANLEAIVSDREFELERKIKQLESRD